MKLSLTNQSSYFGSVGQRLSGVVFGSSFSSSKTPVYVLSSLHVDKEKAQEIAMDWMRVFYGVQVSIMESQEFRIGPSHIGFSVFQRRLKDQSTECISSSSYPTG